MSVRNNKRKNKNIPTPETPEKFDDKIYIDLTKYRRWMDSISVDKFTNHFKDSNEALRHLYFILNNLFVHIEENGQKILSNNVHHCHKLSGKNLKLASKVIDKLYSNTVTTEGNDLWSIGNVDEVRIVGSFVSGTFYPLFVDQHHLLYPSEYYNQRDYHRYSYKTQDIPNTK